MRSLDTLQLKINSETIIKGSEEEKVIEAITKTHLGFVNIKIYVLGCAYRIKDITVEKYRDNKIYIITASKLVEFIPFNSDETT